LSAYVSIRQHTSADILSALFVASGLACLVTHLSFFFLRQFLVTVADDVDNPIKADDASSAWRVVQQRLQAVPTALVDSRPQVCMLAYAAVC
jgi:hypothetical protein